MWSWRGCLPRNKYQVRYIPIQRSVARIYLFIYKQQRPKQQHFSMFAQSQPHIAIPQDVLERIIDLVDIQTKTVLHESDILKSITNNASATEKWGLEVHQYYHAQHRTKFKASLECLPFHAWDDGAPIKKFKASCKQGG